MLLSWFPGQECGDALADVLVGQVEPGGRLPTTWGAAQDDVPVLDTHPTRGALEYSEGLHIGYRAWLRADTPPAYWFGHGLGYTTWSYEGIAVPAAVAAGDGIDVRVRVRNTGTRRGREVVQVYLSRPGSTMERPRRWLAGFAAATADPGQSVDVSVHVAPRAMQHWSVEESVWVTEPGAVQVHAGRSAADLPLAARVELR